MTRREMTLFVVGALTALVLMNVTGANAASRTLFRGAIIMVPAGKACPSGWATVTELNDRFPVGGTSGGSGGSPTHSHGVASHAHTVSSHTHSAPSHSHSLTAHTHALADPFGGSNITVSAARRADFGDGLSRKHTEDPTSGFHHTHSLSGNVQSGGGGTTGTGGADATGSNSPTTVTAVTGSTDAISDLPPYYTVRFCKSG